MVFAICAGLRLARFNVMIDDPEPAGLGGQFLHRHSGAGRRHHRAAADLSVTSSASPGGLVAVWLTLFYTLAIALLMVSRLPVFSGKRVGKRVPPEMVLPVFVLVVLVLRAAGQLSVGGAERSARSSISPACRSAGCPTAITSARTRRRPQPPARRRPSRRARAAAGRRGRRTSGAAELNAPHAARDPRRCRRRTRRPAGRRHA